MNDTKKNTFKSPTFKQHHDSEKRFKERSVGEKSAGDREMEKRDKKRPHFERKGQSEQTREPYAKRNSKEGERRYDKKNERQTGRPSKQPPQQQQITQTTLENAKGSGKVSVMIKSSMTSDQPREKKTGPLSPRAPEKIKKNRAEEMKIYGEASCLALFAQRPENIVRVWATVEVAHKIGDMFSYLAANKKVYHVVDSQELTLVSGSEHHGGICMLVKKSRPFTLTGYLEVPRQQDCLVLLDGVRNAYNIGGIVRTCAFYGIKGIVAEDPELLNSAAAMRVAEGGAEFVHTLQTDNLDNALEQLRQAGYQIIRTTTDKKAKGFDKVRLENKVVFVLSENVNKSRSPEKDQAVNLCFANPLGNNGLNVAVQAGVLLAKWLEK